MVVDAAASPQISRGVCGSGTAEVAWNIVQPLCLSYASTEPAKLLVSGAAVVSRCRAGTDLKRSPAKTYAAAAATIKPLGSFHLPSLCCPRFDGELQAGLHKTRQSICPRVFHRRAC